MSVTPEQVAEARAEIERFIDSVTRHHETGRNLRRPLPPRDVRLFASAQADLARLDEHARIDVTLDVSTPLALCLSCRNTHVGYAPEWPCYEAERIVGVWARK